MLFLGQNYIHIKVLEFFKNEIILNIMIFYFKMIVLAKKILCWLVFFFFVNLVKSRITPEGGALIEKLPPSD